MSFKPVGQGVRRRILDLPGLRLTESVHPSGGTLGWHAHEARCMTLVLVGQMQEQFPSQTVQCGRGGLLIKPPGADHQTRFGPDGARCFIVELSDPARSVPDSVGHQDLDASWTHQVSAELARGDSASETILEGLALQMVGLWQRTQRARGGPPRWLSQIHDAVHSGFRARLSVAELAAGAGVHPDSLARAFRSHYGRSIGQLMRELRLVWAAEQLSGTDRDLATIAVDAGFCDQSHFSRAFRRRFGVAPGWYRSTR